MYNSRIDVICSHCGTGSAATTLAAASGTPPFKRILIANRGEIACRIHRAAKALGIETVGVYTREDAKGLHPKVVDKAVQLKPGATPVAPYLDAVGIAEIAAKEGCSAVHPGYGFLSENEDFGNECAKRNVAFVGPRPETLDLFGDKTKAKHAAVAAGLPVLQSSPGLTDAKAALAYLKANPMDFPLLLKASYGGGGRGQAVVSKIEDFATSFTKCSKEAEMSFGRPEVFIERFLTHTRHIEVQILGDGKGKCVHLFERDCSVQLRKQKQVELAPCTDIAPALRERICSSAVKLCESVTYRNAGTVEFLVEGDLKNPSAGFYFLELNPRIQVEHTITEEITGTDLIAMQLRIAGGASLASLGLEQSKIRFSGCAMQIRVGLAPGGGGTVTDYKVPPGIRVDSAVAAGTAAVTDYDPMIAKMIVKGPNFTATLATARKALSDYVVGGLKLNKEFLNRILTHEEYTPAGAVHTTWVEDRKIQLPPRKGAPAADKSGAGQIYEVTAGIPGQVAEIKVKVGDVVSSGDVVAVISAMKMLNDIVAERPGKVLAILVEQGKQVAEGVSLVKIEASGAAAVQEQGAITQARRSAPIAMSGTGATPLPPSWYASGSPGDSVFSTPVLRSKAKESDPTYQKRMAYHTKMCAELEKRLAKVKEGGGAKAVATHRKRGKFLPRERIEKIIDPGTTFLEIGALMGWPALPIMKTMGFASPSAGVICGVGVVSGRECMFIATDATVAGGTTSPLGLRKVMRAQDIAEANHLPCIYLIDGGGANLGGGSGGGGGAGAIAPGFVIGGYQFKNQARMSAKRIPQLSVVCGMCTAGGAYIPAMCDETIIVKGNGTVYLGGPPLVKAATGEDANEQDLGGGVMHTTKSGTCDHLAPDEETAFQMLRSVVENLQRRNPRATLNNSQAPEPPLYDRDSMLGIIPEATNIPFDIREVIARLVDGSRFHEFKARYGPTLVTGWGHIEGMPIGILGNNGMLFSEAAIKATHFIQICGQRGIPLVFLQNITGFMIGTEYEHKGITKDGAKMINAMTNVPVPKFTVICGASHGAGNYAMCGVAYDPRFHFIWPNSKISVMGGEQAASVVSVVKQNKLKREGKPPLTPEQETKIKKPIVKQYESSSSAYHSTAFGFDDGVIDPRDTRAVLARAISASLNAPYPEGGYGVYRM